MWRNNGNKHGSRIAVRSASLTGSTLARKVPSSRVQSEHAGSTVVYREFKFIENSKAPRAAQQKQIRNAHYEFEAPIHKQNSYLEWLWNSTGVGF
jgi:hypothetical protein